MNPRRLKIVGSISAICWIVLSLKVWAALTPPVPDIDAIRTLAEIYLSLSLAPIFLGALLSIWMVMRPSEWTAFVLGFLALLIFGTMYLFPLVEVFNSPLGDGTFYGAIVGWFRLHSSEFGWQVANVVFLCGSTIFWLTLWVRLARRRFESAKRG